MESSAELDEILRILTRHDVKFVVVGGLAAILHGSPLFTEDVDVVYQTSEDNYHRLIASLKELEATYDDPAGRHFEPNVSRLATMKLHLLKTRCGHLDLLRSIGDNLTYEDLVGRSRIFDLEDLKVFVLDLETIIEAKEYAGRPKDQHALPFLRQLLHETRQSRK